MRATAEFAKRARERTDHFPARRQCGVLLESSTFLSAETIGWTRGGGGLRNTRCHEAVAMMRTLAIAVLALASFSAVAAEVAGQIGRAHV